MKLQTKILLPILGTLLTLITCCTVAVVTIVTRQMEKTILSDLMTTNVTLGRSLDNTVNFCQSIVRSINKAEDMTLLADSLREKSEQNLPIIQDFLKKMNLNYPEFEGISVVDRQGRVFVASHDATGISVASRTYFQKSMAGETYFSSAFKSQVTGKAIVAVSTPLQDSYGRIQGVIYATLTCDFLAKNTVDGIKFGNSGYAFLADKEGSVIAHPDANEIFRLDLNQSKWGRQLLESETEEMVREEGEHEKLFFSYRNEESGMMSVVVIDEEEISSTARDVRNISIGIMFAGTLSMILVLWLTLRPVIRDILSGVSYARQIALGNLEVTHSVKRKDELGELFKNLLVMVEKLREMILDSRKKEENAAQQAEKARQASRQAEAAGQATEEKRQAMLRTADQLEQMSETLSTATNQLAGQIDQTNQGTREGAQRLTEAATALNEMSATIQEVARNAASASDMSENTRKQAVDGANIVSYVVNGIKEAQEQVMFLRDDMVRLDEHAQSISRIMSVISDIADQTNLLALNAAIEAARAGDAGRGFAVVADEVRKLAEKTMASTSEVGNAIDLIQHSTKQSMIELDKSVALITDATKLAQQSGDALKEIVTTAEHTADEVRVIATASEEQSAASEEINRTIHELTEMSQKTACAMNESASAIGKLAEQSAELTTLIEKMRN